MKSNFSNLWLGYSISAAGSSISFFIILIYLYSFTGRALDIGIYTMVAIAASVLSGPVVGVFVDKYDRKKIMIYGNWINGLLIFSIGFVHSLVFVYIVTFLMTVVNKGIVSSRMAMLPDIVDGSSLVKSNARLSMTSFIIRIAGPSLAGAMAALMPFWVIFLVDAVSYWFANIFIAMIDYRREITKENNLQNRFAEMKEGLRILLTRSPLSYFVIVGSLYRIFTSMLPPLLLVFVTKSLHGGSKEFGIISAMVGVGGVVGSLIAPWFGKFFGASTLLTVGMLINSLLLLIFAGTRSFWLSVVAYLLFNINLFNFVINLHSYIQKIVPGNDRGKVFSSVGTIFGPAHLVSITCGAMLADRYDVSNVLIWSFAGLFVAMIFTSMVYFIKNRNHVICSEVTT